jgi:hypothetical protein
VKLIGIEDGRHEFLLTRREKDLLLLVLRLYPRIPAGHQPLSKTRPEEKANQRLLDEALAEARMENKKALEALLSDTKRFKQQGSGWRLSLSSTDVDWLLQVLNDVRIGSWVQLGSPEQPLKELNVRTAPALWAMEMAGAFQMSFLELLKA